ncbi:Peptidase M23 [uncultured Caudovirales phage]|uniref:Peptidase M23 n=1 Tax=uncultured Caudovirales phage TaxID=2100421 RepID=A0A6J5L6X4_9CAUD|nr:Peptidase M23 [uncultured Caudovirales phage]
MSEFDDIAAALKRIESFSSSIDAHWKTIASNMKGSGGGFGPGGGQRGHGKTKGVTDGALADVSGGGGRLPGAEDMAKKLEIQKSNVDRAMYKPMSTLDGMSKSMGGAIRMAAGSRVDAQGNRYAGKFDPETGRPIGGMVGAYDRANAFMPKLAAKVGERNLGDQVLGRSTFMGRASGVAERGINSIDAFAKSGGMFGAKTFNAVYDILPKESQERIQSSMYGLSDTLSLLRGVSSSANQFLPDVGGTMGRATSYYNATLYGGNQRSRADTRGMTYDTMANLQGITSVGSDAHVAQFLASRGMSASKDAGSTYQQTLRTVANAGRYMNISNEDAAASVEGMTSAKGSAEMLRNFGIYTADLTTGKEKTQSQIFEELAQRLTAGRKQANVEQTQASIRRGALGVTIDSFFQGDQQGGQMFKQYMIERASGKTMDLSQSEKMSQPGDNRNPLNAQYELTQKQTGAMNFSETGYISGINMATKALGLLTDVSGGLSQSLGGAAAMIQTLFGNKSFKGMTEGLTTVVDFASKGVSGIAGAIANMDMSMPPMSTAPALFEAGTIGISMGASLGAAAALGSSAAVLGNLGGSGGGGGGGNVAAIGKRGNGKGPATGFQYNPTRPSNNTVPGAQTGTSNYFTPYYVPGQSYGGTPTGMPQAMFDFSDLKGIKPSSEFGVTDDAHPNAHKGTDFPMNTGTSVKAVGAGRVIQASAYGQLGNCVAIVHTGTNGRKITSIYGHLSVIKVTVGQSVSKRQEVGLAGSTGNSTGPHLHLQFCEGEGLNGRVMSMTEAGKMLTDGKNSDGSVWNGSNGSPSDSGTPAYDSEAAAAALAEGKKLQQMPASATNAMKILSGLYSGNQSGILASVQQMAANMGVSQADWNKYLTGDTGSLPGSPTAPPGGYSPPGVPGTPVNNNVSITVQVPDVTSADAIKFGQLVKQYLENNALTSNTGSL